jgi:hypothetical protein
VLDLGRASFWDTLSSNPVATVQTYRPLGVALAWLSYRITDGGVWLQQALNFFITAAAWILALWSVRERLSFAWLSFVCNAGFFSGYIYLFHLHGVFYGPLFVFLAVLLVYDHHVQELGWKQALPLFGAALLAALFHTFALLLFAAFMGGRWLQNLLQGRRASFAAVAVTIALAAVAMKLMVSGSSDFQRESPIRGFLASYGALEINRLLAGLALLLSVATAATLAKAPRARIGSGVVALLMGLLLLRFHIPVILLWIAVCGIKALLLRRIALTALLGACGVLPVATGTGSPTYALFVLMPCCVAAVADALPSFVQLQRRLAWLAIGACAALFVALKLAWPLPVVDKLVLPLRAEKEKTYQMMAAFDWLDTQKDLSGALQLCSSGDLPVLSNDAIHRRFRAPTNEWPFEVYVKARYHDRLSRPSPQLLLCFGGEQRPHSRVLHLIPGRWAGDATVIELDAAAAVPAAAAGAGENRPADTVK